MATQGSFYTLELGVSPGGCRRDDVFVLTDLDAVKRVVMRDLSEGIGVYLAAWYGEVIVLRVHVPGAAPRTIDLLPFVTIRVPGYPDLRFPGGDCDFDFVADEDAHDDEDEWLSSRLFQHLVTPTPTVDWSAARIPALPEPRLAADATVEIVHGGQRRPAIFGHNDYEGGDHLGTRHPLLAPE